MEPEGVQSKERGGWASGLGREGEEASARGVAEEEEEEEGEEEGEEARG